MKRKQIKRSRLTSQNTAYPIFNTTGKASTSIAGLLVFLLGIGLTLFIVVNPMKIGVFEHAKHILSGKEAGLPGGESGARKIAYWQCPMHPTYISDEPTTCGICGMDLVPKYEGESSAPEGERKVKYWRAPMDPTFISDEPGKSPMGMDLVPVYEDGSEDASDSAIKIDPATVQNIGVVSETVERGDLEIEVRTIGNLDYNERNVFWVNTKYNGWIEKVHVNYVGESVSKGQPLFEIYSPDLVSTQEEYLNALAYRDKMLESGFADALRRSENLLTASRSRLSYWDITERQIQRLEEEKRITKTLTVVSPVTGVVIQKMDQALEGMFAKAGMNLYKVADLSNLWVHVDIYEYQLPWISVGQEANVEISYYPGEEFTGRVLFFYPYLEEKTRTVRVCLEIPNDEKKLRPEMFVTVNFSPVAAKNAVLVPEPAVLHSGERDVVVLDLGNGRFEPRDIKLGPQGKGKYQVLEGLEGGERIVTSAQFLIDSESNLREAINKMLMAKKEEPAATKTAPQGSTTKAMPEGSETKKTIDDEATVEALDAVVKAYLPIWKALANDSLEGIEENATTLAAAAREAAGAEISGGMKKHLESVAMGAAAMKSSEIEVARESMKAISRPLVKIFEENDIRMAGRYFIIHCQMVGEKWIQDTDQVSNPFYGSKMLRCGVKTGETR